jgi:hypothetical protein
LASETYKMESIFNLNLCFRVNSLFSILNFLMSGKWRLSKDLSYPFFHHAKTQVDIVEILFFNGQIILLKFSSYHPCQHPFDQ